MKNKYFSHVQPRLSEVSEWIKEGKTEREITKLLGVALSSWGEYKNKYPELKEAIKNIRGERAREEQDQAERVAAVEDALYRSATGYTVKTVKPVPKKNTETITGKDGSRTHKSWEELEMLEVEEHIPPNVTAQIFLMVNKKKGEYKNNPSQYEINKAKLKLAKDKAKKDNW